MRHTSRSVQVVGAFILSASVGMVGVSVASRSEVRADTVRSTMTRHEQPQQQRHTTAPPRTVGGSQTITVTVPSIAVLEVDGNGRITSAATNTGHAPAPGDLVYVRTADGSYQPSGIDLTGRRWRGDFSRTMHFQRQSADDHDVDDQD